MPGLDGRRDGILVANGAASGVDEPCTLLEVLQEIGVDKSKCTLVEGAVDSYDIALRDEGLEVLDTAGFDCLSSSCLLRTMREAIEKARRSNITFRERRIVVVEELFTIKGK